MHLSRKRLVYWKLWLPIASVATVSLLLAGSSTQVLAQDSSGKALPKIRIGSDGRTFTTEDGRPFVPIGVNYFQPGTGWPPQIWKKMDFDVARNDFARMKALGFNCVRVFVTYGSFFWDGENLQPEGLEKFDRLLALAEEAGIYLHPTGPDHWEGWPEWSQADRLCDERALAAVEIFWRKFAARYRGRNAIFAYDLLNEPFASFETKPTEQRWNTWLQTQYGSAEKTAQSWGVAPETIHWGEQPLPPLKDAPGDRQLLDFQHFREDLADQWTQRQTTAIKSVDPAALVTVGLLQYAVPTELCSIRYYAGYRPERQAKLLDFLEIHFYPLSMHEFNEENVQRNLAYLESVVREVAMPGKPVIVAEFGWYGGGKIDVKDQTFAPVTEEEQARWCRGLVETSRGFATGWLQWGLYDHPEATDCSQRIGLLAVDGKPKVWADEFSKLAGVLGGKATPEAKVGTRPTLDWERAITDSAVGRKFGEDYYKAYRAEHSQTQ